MLKLALSAAAVCLLLATPARGSAAKAPATKKGATKADCPPHPVLSTMPGYEIADCDDKPVAAFDFVIDRKGKKEHVEGRFLNYRYVPAGTERPGVLAVLRNLQNAFKSIGGEVLSETDSATTMKLLRDGVETWPGSRPSARSTTRSSRCRKGLPLRSLRPTASRCSA